MGREHMGGAGSGIGSGRHDGRCESAGSGGSRVIDVTDS